MRPTPPLYFVCEPCNHNEHSPERLVDGGCAADGTPVGSARCCPHYTDRYISRLFAGMRERIDAGLTTMRDGEEVPTRKGREEAARRRANKTQTLMGAQNEPPGPTPRMDAKRAARGIPVESLEERTAKWQERQDLLEGRKRRGEEIADARRLHKPLPPMPPLPGAINCPDAPEQQVQADEETPSIRRKKPLRAGKHYPPQSPQTPQTAP